MGFGGALMGTQLLGSLLMGSQDPSTALLQKSQPAFQAAQQMQAGDTAISVKTQEDQAKAVLADAAAQAQKSAYESKQQIGEQAMAYNSSGVKLEGSPLVVLAKSRQLAQQQVQSILTRGQNQANQINAGAAITANEGRAQLLGASSKYSSALASSQIGASQNQLAGLLKNLQGLGSVIGGNPGSPLGYP